mmetsp:Transcript_15636/g.31762  ORF Transcript_15636/g.31762 Transcript_15636/m.31762 type:complete len:327 (+) Transcript_15636:114-1094(+)
MILYTLVARSKDGVILVESTLSGVEGNYPQVSVELLKTVVSSFRMNSGVLGETNIHNSVEELLPDGGRKTFVQRHDEPLFGGILGAFTEGNCGFFSNINGANEDVESGNGASGYNANQKSGELDYYFHLIRRSNIICLCISDDLDIRYHEVNYNFLEDVKDKFMKNYSSHRVAKAKAYDMDKSFRIELGKLLHFYNENRGSMIRNDKVNILLTKADDLKLVLGRNIKMTLARENKLNALVDQSEEMLSETKVTRLNVSILILFLCLAIFDNYFCLGSKVFTKRSSTLKTKMVRSNMSYYVYALTFGVLVLYLFIGGICGYNFSKCG